LLNCPVQPIYMCSTSFANVPFIIPFPWVSALKEMASHSASRYLKKLPVAGFLPAKVILTPSTSNRHLAMELARYAKTNRAILIFANTRATKSFNPLRLGGFAETLISVSHVPVVLLNSKAICSTKISSVLFPTDFSVESKRALTLLKPIVKNLGAKIFVFNQTPFFRISKEDLIQYLPGEIAQYEKLKKTVINERLYSAELFMKHLKKGNIESVYVTENQNKPVQEQAVDFARKNKVNLIALTTSGGPLSQAILGGISRDVILQAPCPVLVMNNKNNKK
ncbi:MAG: universal stress protein, partial [Bdellovibrionota bacterium]